MGLLEFSEKWIEENVNTELFNTKMKDAVRQVIDLFIQQKHSGASMSMMLWYVYRLMEDYGNQKG